MESYEIDIAKYFTEETKPVVWIYVLCYNEAAIIPFIIQYWKQYAMKVFVYDNGSTDGSIEMLKQYDWIEVRHFDSDGFNDYIHMYIKSMVWKEAKNRGVDFVQVCDFDEVLWSNDIISELQKFKDSDSGIWNCKCYNISTLRFPEYNDEFLHDREDAVCTYDENMSKKLLFKPDCIDEMNYAPGCHSCHPVGSNTSLYDNDNIKMFHIKHLGLEYTIDKYRKLNERLSELNKRMTWGLHYAYSDEKIAEEFNERYNNGIKINSKPSDK